MLLVFRGIGTWGLKMKIIDEKLFDFSKFASFFENAEDFNEFFSNLRLFCISQADFFRSIDQTKEKHGGIPKYWCEGTYIEIITCFIMVYNKYKFFFEKAQIPLSRIQLSEEDSIREYFDELKELYQEKDEKQQEKT